MAAFADEALEYAVLTKAALRSIMLLHARIPRRQFESAAQGAQQCRQAGAPLGPCRHGRHRIARGCHAPIELSYEWLSMTIKLKPYAI
jgi:hypothetical protein